MIVSHAHRFIFVKTKKTAGTSIEVVLSQLAGADAIVTPFGVEEEGHTARNAGESSILNTLPALLAERELGEAIRHPLRYAGRYRARYYNHMPASLVRRRVGPATWDGYFTFCFERNPWDKVLSWYRWLTRGATNPPPFDEWVRRTGGAGASDWRRYAVGGAIAVDAVGRYESLEADLERFLRQVGCAASFELPKTKVTRGDGPPAERYSDAGAERVRQVFRREIDAFGYECPPELRR